MTDLRQRVEALEGHTPTVVGGSHITTYRTPDGEFVRRADVLALLDTEGTDEHSIPGLFTLDYARQNRICRICGEADKVSPSNPLVLNYGKEYAHHLCLQSATTHTTPRGEAQ